ncbi:MAG: HAMP domain-containing histidine kinase [Clostridia bacterium]|nr:HAMP domain-containing histidine kinase [Clostridia bacterium]
MRLKTKLIAISCVLMTAALALCCVLLLRTMREQRENDAVAQASSDFDANTRKLRNIQVFPSAQTEQTYLIYLLREIQTEDEWTLCADETYLVDNCGFSPEAYLPELALAEIQTRFITISDRSVLLLGTRINHTYGSYTVCMVRDMGVLHVSMQTLTRQCALIGGGILLAFLLLVYLLTALSLKPVEILQSGANAIASGQYETRIRIRQKDEIGALAKDFNTMAEAVQKSITDLREQNAQKQAFINNLSHEMKTPVTSLLLNSDTLLTRSISEQDRQRMLLRIHEQAKWIERLSQKLMQLVLLQNEIILSPCPAKDLCDAVKETVSDSLNAANIQLQVSCTDAVYEGDSDLLRSALVNLIENAIKASSPGSTIELLAEEKLIAVRDYGCGIPKDEIGRITEPFYMVDRSRSKKKGGSGLGLALVKEIARAHHASLEIESEFGKGTSVFFRFSGAK